MTVSQRRAAWKRTIRLKDLLGPENDGAAVRTCAAAMVARLKRVRGYEQHGMDSLSQIVDELEGIAESTPDEYADENWTILQHFNGVLSELYDWADAERVWIA